MPERKHDFDIYDFLGENYGDDIGCMMNLSIRAMFGGFGAIVGGAIAFGGMSMIASSLIQEGNIALGNLAEAWAVPVGLLGAVIGLAIGARKYY